MRLLMAACALLCLSSFKGRAENAVRPGAFVVEPPTLICLGFEWEIAGDQYVWIAPPKGQLRDYEVNARNAQRFKSVSDLAAATGAEAHGVELDYDIFVNVKPPDPKTPHAVYHSADFDFRLKPGSKAVDAGMRLPNINDDLAGQAPDLGAYETGKPLPEYGPRVKTSQPFYR